jgi:drug/metabolite transporter (DMT)-like permease
MNAWIAFTVLAAIMQAVRTAGQKQISSTVSPMGATLVRYVFGLPFAIAYLLFISQFTAIDLFSEALTNPRFIIYGLMAGVAQIVATVLLVKCFSFRNFTVGTSFAKTEAIQTAIFGMLLFGSALSALGWLAVAVGVLGIFIVSIPTKTGQWEPMNVVLGTLSGTAFALTSLWLREASLSLELPALKSAAVTLVFMVSAQAIMCMAYIAVREREQFFAIRKRIKLAWFVGLTSALGSVGWFTAMTLQNPALVKSLGQIEFIFTLLLTTFFFKEKVTRRELTGVLAIVASVLLILQAT